MNDGVNSDTTDYEVNPVAKIVQSRFTNLMNGDKKHLPHFGCTAVALYADLLYICLYSYLPCTLYRPNKNRPWCNLWRTSNLPYPNYEFQFQFEYEFESISVANWA